MRFAYFQGCKIPFFMKDYGISFEAVMQNLGVELVKLPFHCCGYPERGNDFFASMYSAIKNLAIAQTHGLDIITPCKCCFGQFKHASHWYACDNDLKKKIDALLEEENLFWSGQTNVKHLLEFLYRDFGLDEIKRKVRVPQENKKVAVQYGCHALRPFSITGFDYPGSPKIFEELIKAIGFKTVEWSKSTECCGNPVFETDKELSLNILANKFESAFKAGADYICNACTHCQIQYEQRGSKASFETFGVVPLLFTQLLGRALGLPESSLKFIDDSF